MKKLTKIVLLIFLLWTIDYGLSTKCGSIAKTYAAVPHLINYQGRLTDASGTPLNGTYALTFRIYDAETAGNLLWEETHQGVVIQKGIFGILLGSVTNLDLPFDKPYFLEIKVGSEVMSPRQRITSSAYAIRAEKAEEAKVKASGTDTTAGNLDEKVAKSIVVTSNKLELVGDSASPGNNKVYATDVSGIKGWHDPIGIPRGIQVFTSSGTWTKPAGVTKVWVKSVGGGGGGAGGAGKGGGGGGAAYAEGIVSVSGNVSVTVGAGGAGGGAGDGSAGGDSSFGTDIVADGGSGGIRYAAGGDGGAGGLVANCTGAIKITGSFGGRGWDSAYVGGAGGPSLLGGGFTSESDNQPGDPGIPYGGGGGGVGITGYGGAGAAGIVIVYW